MSSKKVLVTCADKYMGSAVVKKFKTLDCDVFADCQELVTQTQCEGLIQTVGDID
ncbi:MAG: hypothetical protein HOI07_08295, partial [Betaproteobacteria bacterium]|nr:hypothetical protein [Betaproteobacteria bacterium]